MHYHRDERDQYVRYLADMFPRCFFEDPERRLPLKKNIAADVAQQCTLDPATVAQMLGWYQSHFAYQRKILSGAERIDLNGKKAGTVTLQEQEEARRKIMVRKKELAEQRATSPGPSPTAKTPANTGHMINGATMASNKSAAPPSLHPALAPLHEAIIIASNLMTNAQYEPMRPVLATAALKEIIGTAEKLIGSLQQPKE